MNFNAFQSVSLVALFKSLKAHFSLLRQLTKRDVIGRYRGSMLGIGWSFLNPLLMLCVFTFVFSVVFKAKWGVAPVGGGEGQAVFAVILFVGLIMHALLAEVITTSPACIVGNANYVKKVIFPLEILPVVKIAGALIHAFISLIVWLLAYLLLVGVPSWHAILLPVVIVPFVTLCLGFAFILASLGVFLRDVGQTMGILATILLFLSPIFFPIDRLPEAYQPLLLANPLTFIIQQSRGVLIWGEVPDFAGLVIYMLIALSTLWIGFAWFQKSRNGFADVL